MNFDGNLQIDGLMRRTDVLAIIGVRLDRLIGRLLLGESSPDRVACLFGFPKQRLIGLSATDGFGRREGEEFMDLVVTAEGQELGRLVGDRSRLPGRPSALTPSTDERPARTTSRGPRMPAVTSADQASSTDPSWATSG